MKQPSVWNKMFGKLGGNGKQDEMKPGSIISEKIRSNSEEDNNLVNNSMLQVKNDIDN